MNPFKPSVVLTVLQGLYVAAPLCVCTERTERFAAHLEQRVTSTDAENKGISPVVE